MLGNRWARNFTVSNDDVDYLMNTLLEQETPMTTRQLSRLLIEQRLEAEQAALEEQYRDTRVYNPTEEYGVGDRLVFTQMELATAKVQAIRVGDNAEHSEFTVLTVEFDDDEHNLPDKPREFAASLQTAHPLSTSEQENPLTTQANIDTDELLSVEDNYIMRVVHDALRENSSLKRVAGFWFPEELVLDCDIGILHLSEAVLDIAGGGPLPTKEIIDQIGEIGDAPIQLQVFSLNLALNEDERFDEVGPAGKVMWYLNRMAPDAVREAPSLLKYTVIEYDDELLEDAMFDLETELDDEFTDIEFEGKLPRATTVLIFPHRRVGTLPLNAKNLAIFPAARAPRIYVELLDAQDGQSFNGWVVHGHNYVYGLQDYYTKHHLPVGAYVTVEPGDKPRQIRVSHEGYKARTEWIRILTPQNNRIHFENKKRQIGAEYDDLIIIGVDDIAAVDKLAQTYENKPLATIIRDVLHALGELSPQKTVHAVTLYSTVNVIRRCAPGPIFATLSANPDFEDLGDHYWKLNESQ
jgi:hypothetical protein